MATELDFADLLAHPGNGGLRPAEVGSATVPATAVGHGIWPTAVAGVAVCASTAAPKDTADLTVFTARAPKDSWAFEALLRRLNAQGCSAVVFPAPLALAHGSARVARRLDVALFVADDPLETVRAAWELQAGQDALALRYVRRVARSVEYRASHVSDLLEHLAAGLGHSVALADVEGAFLQAGRNLPDDLHRALTGPGWAHSAAFPDGAGVSVSVQSAQREGLRLVVHDDHLGRGQLAALIDAAEVAMPMVAARLLTDEVADVNDAAISSAVLRDFLDQPGAQRGEVRRRMTERGWRVNGTHLGFRLVGREQLVPLELLRRVRREVSEWMVNVHTVTEGLGVTGWLTFPEPPSPAMLERNIARLRGLHETLRADFGVATGVGTPEVGPEGLAVSIEAAHEAARVASHWENSGYYLRIDALGLEQLLLSRTENDTFLPAARSLLQPLLEGSGNLVETLSSYLDHESNVVATAAELNVHRNTVAARVDKAVSLLGLDLSDSDTRLAVRLALRATQA
ncbi:MAG: PucR family transcriptional regulator [Galactobacter sp.]